MGKEKANVLEDKAVSCARQSRPIFSTLTPFELLKFNFCLDILGFHSLADDYFSLLTQDACRLVQAPSYRKSLLPSSPGFSRKSQFCL
jgi:hypothetical protein